MRSLREEHGLTQRELADKAGIQQSYLSRLESGMRTLRPDVFALARIAQALGITLEEILIQTGVWATTEPSKDLRWKRLERTFRSMSEERQEELLAIAQALLHLPPTWKPTAGTETPLTPRVIGQSEEPETRAEDQAEDRQSTPSAQRGN